MGLKPDHWIRQMALEHKMIEPFVDHQVRDGLISFGLSSYGYDIRVAQEFKIFTPGLGDLTVVDPKRFDTRAMVDYHGDTCVIPPNSFALGRSVEYFRVPRSVLCVCLGKSSYARCFRGDTRVALVDGSAPTLEEMTRRAESGELFWGYSIGPNGRMIVALLDSPRHVGRDALVEVVLDTTESIFCTPDHLFMLRDGRWIEAGNLRANDSLMPLYRTTARGYEVVYQPLNGCLYPTHRMADEWNLRNEIYADSPGSHRHHLDRDRRNNNPDNFRHEERYAEIRARVIDQRLHPSPETRQAHRESMISRYSNPAERARQSARSTVAWARDDGTRRQAQAELMRRIKTRADVTPELLRWALDQAGSIRGAARLLDCDRSVFRRFPEVIHAFRGQGRNHRVLAVRDVPGTHDVYCLTVPEAGNFALEAGTFVHNCGIIVNITPFEPEWEGFVTLEISNTTPLPAKIYAGEGIAQVLFFEADEECVVSYADKKGKYQGQESIVLPRL